MKKALPIVVVILIILGIFFVWNLFKNENPQSAVINFEECVEAGNPVMESYPRQCRAGDQSFTENIGNEIESTDPIREDNPAPVACSQESKLCSDGSAVGRTGPNCEFAQCPSTGGNGGILLYNSGIEGTVMAGPTCPVVQNPPDPDCDDKPIETNVSVYKASDTSRSVEMLESDEGGKFKVSLPPGDYVVMAGSFGVPFPSCSDTSATVGSSGYTQIIVSCDTGIR